MNFRVVTWHEVRQKKAFHMICLHVESQKKNGKNEPVYTTEIES